MKTTISKSGQKIVFFCFCEFHRISKGSVLRPSFLLAISFFCGILQASEEDDLLPRLLIPLRFKDFSVVGPVTAVGAERLRHEKLHAGGQNGFEFLRHPKTGEYVRTQTVDEYEQAQLIGARTYTTYDDSMQSWFQEASAALRFLKRARPANVNPFEVFDYRRLPVGWLTWYGSEEKSRLEADEIAGLTLADYVRSGLIQNLQKSESVVSFTYGPKRYRVQAIATGDHDHDRETDLLISIACHHLEGAGRSYNLYLVRMREGGLLKADLFL